MKIQAPLSATTQSVTSTATSELGGAKGGVYIFTVTGSYTSGTDDLNDLTVWVTFGPTGSVATPVAGTTGFPIAANDRPVALVLGDEVKFRAISTSTTVNLTWSRVSDEC